MSVILGYYRHCPRRGEGEYGYPNIQQASVKSEKKNCKEYFIDINVLLNSCKQLYKINLSLRAFFKSKNKNLDINAS